MDFKFLGQAYNIYKAAGNEIKYLGYFRNVRQSSIPDLVKIKKNDELVNKIILYEKYFSDIINELFNKRIAIHFTFWIWNISYDNKNYYIAKNIFIFLNSLERIGIYEKIGVDIRSIMVEMIKEKLISLNMALISKYNTLFSRMILDDLSSQCLVAKNPDVFMKYVTQYYIILEGTKTKVTSLK